MQGRGGGGGRYQRVGGRYLRGGIRYPTLCPFPTATLTESGSISKATYLSQCRALLAPVILRRKKGIRYLMRKGSPTSLPLGISSTSLSPPPPQTRSQLTCSNAIEQAKDSDWSSAVCWDEGTNGRRFLGMLGVRKVTD